SVRAAATPTAAARAWSVASVFAPIPQRRPRRIRSQAGQSAGLTSTRHTARQSRTAAGSARGRSVRTRTVSPPAAQARAMGPRQAVTRASTAIGGTLFPQPVGAGGGEPLGLRPVVGPGQDGGSGP